MERNKRGDLEALVVSQKEQLSRYEKRLKDVVTAYKGLLKEKEALETSLSALTTTSNNEGQAAKPSENITVADDTDSEVGATIESVDASPSNSSVDDDKSNLQTQIITLMNSLATLSAEKSRMEASFQADKKQLRSQLSQKQQTIADLQSTVKEKEEQAKAAVEEVKAKWIIERQEREKETNNQMVMIRELQKLYADERHLKENIEMQLNNFKTQFANNEADNSSLHDLQIQLKEAKAQLKKLQVHSKSNSNEELADSAAVLRQVQQEMQQLKEQHAIAIKNEQKRVLHAEEESRKQAALHEDRVANLEARLAELSSTVGTYDRLRQQDQESIQMLRKKLHELERNTDIANQRALNDNDKSYHNLNGNAAAAAHDIVSIVDEIMRLKKLLISENARSTNPIDVAKVFAVGADHVHCQEEYNRLQQQSEASKAEAVELKEKVQVQKTHIATLQEKVKVLNRNIDEQELELKQQAEKLRYAVKEERAKWKESIAEAENEYRVKLIDLEQQLQKQRQRSLQLLDEKEHEIKTLQTSFEVFHSATAMPMVAAAAASSHFNESQAADRSTSDAESTDGNMPTTTTQKRKTSVKATKLSMGENCHMLHYANEIARKDIEITGLRKAKYVAESSLRKAIHEKVSVQEELNDKIAVLEEQVDRLERCKTREGANLEYLKNVIISFIVTKDADGKRHMLNAISAVLQFTPTETHAINAAFHRK